MKHFVCPECGFTSKLHGTCQNDVCLQQGGRLAECHCDDDLHDMILRPVKSSDTEEDIADQQKDAQKSGYSVNTLDLDAPDEVI